MVSFGDAGKHSEMSGEVLCNARVRANSAKPTVSVSLLSSKNSTKYNNISFQ